MKIRVKLLQRNNIWYIRYNENGKFKWKSTGTVDQDIAEILRSEYEHKLLKSKLTGKPVDPPKSPTIFDFFKRYLKHSKATSSRSTSEGINYHLKSVMNFFARKGIKRFDEIDANLIQQFQMDTLQQNSARTFNNQLGILKTALNKAVEWGVIDSNPIAKVKKIKIPIRFHYFTPGEIDYQLRQATPYLKRLIGLGAYAGLRRAEMAELRITDIDFKNKVIKIRSDQDYTPKGKRPRAIPLNDNLIQILKSTQTLSGDWVLPRTMKDGSPFNFHRLQELSRAYKKFLRKINQDGRLHDLRHTFGTYGVAAGIPIRDVQAWMGHSDIQSTMIYTHHAPDVNSDKINLLPY